MRSFGLMALPPSGVVDPVIAIAASRADALGVINLEYVSDLEVARKAILGLARYTDKRSGIRFDSSMPASVTGLLPDLPSQIRVALVTCSDLRNWPAIVSACRQRGLEVFLEVTNAREATYARQLDVDALIAKGHESAGWVDDETTFVLLQHLTAPGSLPVWAYGGIGLHTVAACYVAGAAGVVLDSQLALARESSLPQTVKDAIAAMDGSETGCMGTELAALCRVYMRPGAGALRELGQRAARLAQDDCPLDEARASWRETVSAHVGWGSLDEHVWPLGQDAVFAQGLARRYVSVGGILGAMRDAVATHVSQAAELCPLDADSPLAIAHGCRYPIAQGPMTRVSDTPDFALRVAENGGLPFVALGLLRATEVDALLAQTAQLLGDRPWGVGLLGFAPAALRKEQQEVICRFRPPYALIAGGRPDQARRLEEVGVKTYLHVPSPGLLRLFLHDGARRFVFEGRECGGHVGPRSSFVLWDTMVDALLSEGLPPQELRKCQVLLAGGIHDRISAAMAAVVTASLAGCGVQVGVLLGTAYLFTEEAVASGAIVPAFQREALRCEHTVLLESGPGHETRCIPTPFVEVFTRERVRLFREEKPAQEVREALEELNVGRLRLAAKGLVRDASPCTGAEGPRLVAVGEEAQYRDGLYMIGQVAALHDRLTTLADLHREVAEGSSDALRALAKMQPAPAAGPTAKPSEIAIIGMSALLPGARSLSEFWANILNHHSAIEEIPPERWDADLYFDPNRDARDKIYSRWGGFIDDVLFDPLEFGIPPASLSSIDPSHLLCLLAARDALADAGYSQRPFDRSRTAVILGASGGTGDLGARYLLRSGLPLLFGKAGFEIAADAGSVLPSWTEDSFAGLLLNVAAGRIANRFDLGGANYVVDAACASSLAAVCLAVRELETHNAETVIVGGFDTVQNPFGYLCFSKTQALSASGQPRVFDAAADGIVISEGIAMLVLKRLADAERDGDRIYAVIQAVGGSSDGRAMGMTAPRPEGQMLAFERTYAKAGFSPTTVALFEAHGTGTVVGDRTEAASLSRFLRTAGARTQSHALGSVKSMIGHTKATAGVAGLIKVACALHQRVLPPTLGVTRPNPKAGFGEGPLYVNSEARPWIHDADVHPRRAAVSAFGFGGANFHAVVEEYTGDFVSQAREAVAQEWPSELLLWRADSRDTLFSALEALRLAFEAGARPALRDLAFTLWKEAEAHRTPKAVCLAVVAESVADLREKIERAASLLKMPGRLDTQDHTDVYFADQPLTTTGKVAFLFPGQGSQAPNMLRELAMHFEEVRELFEQTDKVLAGRYPKALSSYVYPPPAFTPEEQRDQHHVLMQTNIAQPALGAADAGALHLLRALGIQPDLVAGHSYGEYVALYAAGAIDLPTLAALSEIRGRSIIEAAKGDLGTMAAVRASPDRVRSALRDDQVWLANLNAPNQTVISGAKDRIAAAVAQLASQGISARGLPVACAFHSPLMAPAQERLAAALASTSFMVPQIEVFSNTTAAPYPREPQAIRSLLADHLLRPVRFSDEIEAMYTAGARVFVEVGPGSVLTGLTKQILGEREHLAVALDATRSGELRQLHRLLAQLAVYGVGVQLDRLFQGRKVKKLDLEALAVETGPNALPGSAWLVNGRRARPANAGEELPLRPPLESVTLQYRGCGDAAAGQGQLSPERLTTDRGDGAGPQPALPPSEVPGASAPLAAGNDVEQVMASFQQTMNRFLETQKNVMLAYLHGRESQRVEITGETAPVPAAQAASAPQLPAIEAAPAATHPSVSTTAAEPGGRAAGSPSVPGNQAIPDLGKESLTKQLLRIVSERTGYPPEMLGLDVDIEAQLGIDSIKRVEILGILQRECVPPDRRISGDAMEKLTGLRTLQGIVDWVVTSVGDGGGPDQKSATPNEGKDPALGVPTPPGDAGRPVPDNLNAPATDVVSTGEVSRLVVRVMDAPPLASQPEPFAPDDLILITDDQRGVAAALMERIRAGGGRVLLLRHVPDAVSVDGARGQADLTDPAAVDALVAAIRQQHGIPTGLIHLLPLGARETPLSLVSWRERLRCEVKSLFFLARALAPDLARPRNAKCRLMAATVMGGAYGLRNLSRQGFFPGQGGVAGLVKTLALEWPHARCRVVDFAPGSPAPDLADYLLAELSADDGLTEVGYAGRTRHWPGLALAPLDQRGPVRLAPDSDWVLLVTGGARGITAEVACRLAERYRPRLVLTGSSPAPEAEESRRTAGLESPRDLKAALMMTLRETIDPVTVAEVEAAYTRLLKAREMRRNMVRMRQAGAQITYRQADARDEAAMRSLIDDIYREYGRLDGVIHGTGIIDDKLIQDKRPDSFDRVFDTKVDSAYLLSQLLKPDSLKFMAFFSSAAGIFGNRGQGDYAAANEVMNKLALDLDRRWPGRVFSINWGPWLKTGMVSPELQREFAKRDIQLIPISEGCDSFDHELCYGQKGEPVVVIARGSWGASAVADRPAETSASVPAAMATSAAPATALKLPLPLLGHEQSAIWVGDEMQLRFTLDPARHLYLQDHRLDGRPVFPFAVAMELITEVVQQGWPSLHVTSVRELQVLRGIILDGAPKVLTVTVRGASQSFEPGASGCAHVEIMDGSDPVRPCYRAAVELSDQPLAPPPYRLPATARLEPFVLSPEQAYERWLFHGPRFRGITEIAGVADDRLVATCQPSSPKALLAGDPTGEWLIDPVIFDSALQMILLWTRSRRDATPLPSEFKRYLRYGSLSQSPVRCYLRVTDQAESPIVSADIAFLGPNDVLLGLLEEMKCPFSKALNRLGGNQASS